MKTSYKLVFETEQGKDATITVSNAKSMSDSVVNGVMNKLLASGIISTKNGLITAKKKAVLENIGVVEFAVKAE